MTSVAKLAELALVLAVSYLVAFKMIPRCFTGLGRMLGFAMRPTPLTEKRIRRFKQIKRGYTCFVLMTMASVMSLGLELFVNNKPIYIQYGEKKQFAAIANWANFLIPLARFNDRVAANDYGLDDAGDLDCREYAAWIGNPAVLQTKITDMEAGIAKDEARFRKVLEEQAKKRGLQYEPSQTLPESKLAEYDNIRKKAERLRVLHAELESGKASILMPLFPYSPQEQLLGLPGAPPHKPFQKGFPILGTDEQGREIVSQLLYGFRICFAFALFVAFTGYVVGVLVGGAMGYYGGWFDIFAQRVIEIWSSIPFLFTMIIISSVIGPVSSGAKFVILAFMLVGLGGWTGITYTVRGEFYRERSRDYVQAARALGVKDLKTMVRHILPNSLVPIVTFFPFAVVGYMSALVSLDFLGYGLPPGTPSWGALLRQGSENIVNYPHLVYIPVLAFAGTLFCVVMVGEAVREAFDPKKYARLR
ncbi:MAG: ABC transporter permease subunit [Desulfobacterales bacterium]|jgi:microcin C transport system permease protein